MEQNPKQKIAASDFTTLMYQKGYRRNYRLSEPGPVVVRTLGACLDKFLAGYRLDEKKCNSLQLDTPSPYNDNINCRFKIDYDEVKGFLVRELTIEDKLSQAQRYYRLSNNQQIPGASSIEGLFPKPKPWDDLAKGKFRPKR